MKLSSTETMTATRGFFKGIFESIGDGFSATKNFIVGTAEKTAENGEVIAATPSILGKAGTFFSEWGEGIASGSTSSLSGLSFTVAGVAGLAALILSRGKSRKAAQAAAQLKVK